MLTLYDNFASVAAQKVRLCLAEKELAWTTVEVDLRAGAMLEANYLKLNPAGVVPTLVHDDAVLVESTSINEYLDEAFPERPLRPATPLGRARIRVVTKRVDEEIQRATGNVSMAVYIRHHHLKKSVQELDAYFARMPDPERVARQRTVIEQGLDAPAVVVALQVFSRWIDDLDRQIRGSAWMAGEVFTLADIACMPFLARLEMLAMEGLWANGRRPGLARWWAACKTRASYRKQVHERFPDAFRAGMRQHGEQCWPQAARLLGVVTA